MNIIKSVIIFLSFSIFTLSAQQWTPDILGDDYQMRYVTQPNDYSGKIISTIIRKQSKCNTTKAILYIHGYNDYFFQKELSSTFTDSCFNFYAVDLRKYGRSFFPGQKRYEVHKIDEYFEDIDSAMVQIQKDGNDEIILMGHSTGGLLASYYMGKDAGAKYPIKAVILNSPFLDMNLSGFQENILVPIVSFMAKISKNIKIPQDGSSAYAQSLLKEYHGEWDYDTKLKLSQSPDVTSGWIAAIYNAQRFLHKGINIKVPTLLLHSDKSVKGGQWSIEYNNGDAVLDVNDISKYGKLLSSKLTEYTIKNGIHDLYLSKSSVRYPLYKATFEWIRKNGL